MEPTSDPHEALERLLAARDEGRLDALVDKHGLELLVVFGSALDEGASPEDLDLAVGHDGRANLLEMMTDLYHLTRFERFDLLDLERASVVPRAEALGQGSPLLEVVPGTFAERQMADVALSMDTRWMRDIQLRQLAGR
jgi:predicted nucleotidyltransferase